MADLPQKKPLHANHRARMREKLMTLGTEPFADHELLEMLLYYAIPRSDTNAIAHKLLQEFRDLRGVLEATPEELKNVAGVGENSSALFALMRECTRRYHSERTVKRLHLHTTQAIGTFIAPLFIGRREEQIYLLCLDKQKTPVYGGFLQVGSLTMAALDVSKVVSAAVSVSAAYVVIAHNHPSGFAVPSDADVVATAHLKRALEEVGIALLDHLIVADPMDVSDPVGDYISLSDSRLL